MYVYFAVTSQSFLKSSVLRSIAKHVALRLMSLPAYFLYKYFASMINNVADSIL